MAIISKISLMMLNYLSRVVWPSNYKKKDNVLSNICERISSSNQCQVTKGGAVAEWSKALL